MMLRSIFMDVILCRSSHPQNACLSRGLLADRTLGSFIPGWFLLVPIFPEPFPLLMFFHISSLLKWDPERPLGHLAVASLGWEKENRHMLNMSRLESFISQHPKAPSAQRILHPSVRRSRVYKGRKCNYISVTKLLQNCQLRHFPRKTVYHRQHQVQSVLPYRIYFVWGLQ